MNDMSAAEQRFRAEARLSRRAAFDFGIHVIVGVVLYLTIFAAAVGVSVAGERFQEMAHLHRVAILGLKVVEHVLSFSDALLCVVYLFRTGYTFLRNLFSHDARKS
jgi:radical SAM superfamily enzyme with C-terminal helix-hairpin-helix motif